MLRRDGCILRGENAHRLLAASRLRAAELGRVCEEGPNEHDEVGQCAEECNEVSLKTNFVSTVRKNPRRAEASVQGQEEHRLR